MVEELHKFGVEDNNGRKGRQVRGKRGGARRRKVGKQVGGRLVGGWTNLVGKLGFIHLSSKWRQMGWCAHGCQVTLANVNYYKILHHMQFMFCNITTLNIYCCFLTFLFFPNSFLHIFNCCMLHEPHTFLCVS